MSVGRRGEGAILDPRTIPVPVVAEQLGVQIKVAIANQHAFSVGSDQHNSPRVQGSPSSFGMLILGRTWGTRGPGIDFTTVAEAFD